MNRTTVGLFREFKPCCIAALTLACFLGGQIDAGAGSTPFSRVFVFGDSLSDTGNFHRLTGGYPPPPYFGGRFSNGRLWVEYLAESLGMQILPGDNYAVAGATTGHDNSNDGVLGLEYPGLQDQIAVFLASHQTGGADPDALYVLWAGANDFFVVLEAGGNPASLIGAGVANTVHAVQLLRAAGARHILVVNVPDLGLTPFGRGSGMGAAISQLSAAYNQALEAALRALAGAGVPNIHVDAFSTLQAMVNLPGEFGFTNVTDPLLFTGGESDEFLFWDAVHPTTRGHEVLADAARNCLIDYFSARRGKGNPPALVNSLNGLVRGGLGD